MVTVTLMTQHLEGDNKDLPYPNQGLISRLIADFQNLYIVTLIDNLNELKKQKINVKDQYRKLIRVIENSYK